MLVWTMYKTRSIPAISSEEINIFEGVSKSSGGTKDHRQFRSFASVNLKLHCSMKKLVISAIMLMASHIVMAQAFELRLLNHWDNPNGTVERGYAGRSIWKWDEIPTNKTPMPKALKARYEEYGSINKSYGINGTVLNNVNAKPIALSTPMLLKTAKIADILRDYGIKVYLSVNFASPKALGDLDTADPRRYSSGGKRR